MRTKPIGSPKRGVMVIAGQSPAENAAESMPCQVPTMMAKKASIDKAMTPTIMAARTRSVVEGSMLAGLVTDPGYRGSIGGIPARGEFSPGD